MFENFANISSTQYLCSKSIFVMETGNMTYIKDIRGDVLVEIVDLKRATAMECDEFREVLLTDIKNGWKKIVVDLSKCLFIDSTFLGSLVIAQKTLNKINGDLRISGAKVDLHTILELTGTSRIFQLFQNKDEAVSSFW